MAFGEEDSGGSIVGIVIAAAVGGAMWWIYTRQTGGGSGNDDPTPSGCTRTCPTGQHPNAACTGCDLDTTGGGVPTGSTWYKANGPTANMPNARCSGGSCGTGSGNSGGNRWENNSKGFMDIGFEVVVYFSTGKMCSGGHIGLKHGGPNHTPPCEYKLGSACCCWFDSGLRDDGTVYMEIERPHPKNSGTKYYGNIGRRIDTGAPLGLRWHISKEGAGIRLMHWVDTSGQVGANKWKQTYNILDTGQIMPKDYYSHITNLQNIEIRISDIACKAIKMLQGPVSRKIVAGGSSAYTLLRRYSYMAPLYMQNRMPLVVPTLP